jgi:hypothetical protein
VDARLHAAANGHDILFETTVTLTVQEATEIAVNDGSQVRRFPFATFAVQDLALSTPNAWVAVAAADGAWSSSVVAGDLRSITVSRSGPDVIVKVAWEGRGAADAAHYLLLGEASSLEGYAEVAELARMDREELGLSYLGDGVGAGVPWVNGAGKIGVVATSTASDWYESLWGTTRTWKIEVEASGAQNGKLLRVIVPAALSRDLSPAATLDGKPASLAASTLAQSDGTASFTVQIPHFSLRTVQIKTVTPGVPPIFMWLTLALGAVVGGESFILARSALRSKAAARGMGRSEGGSPGPGAPSSGAARSEAVRRALGGPPQGSPPQSEVAETEFKSNLLKKLQEGTGGPAQPGRRARYARCNACAKPIVFAAGAATVVCPHCQAQNVSSET